MAEVLDLRELGDDDGRDPPVVPGLQPTTAEQGGEVASLGGPGPPWRRRAAVVVVVALGVASAYVLTVGRPDSEPGAPGRSTPAITDPPAEQAARAALDAWARFASTGEVGALGDNFDHAGPQFARLRAEAPTVATNSAAGSPPYAFSATVLYTTVGRNPDEQLVGADVVLVRPGGPDQRFAWELVLRRASPDARWLLWTVRDRAGPSATAGSGGAP